MSTRDKKLLIILAGVAVLALTYFFVFSPQADKREQLQLENTDLKSQYSQLSTLAAKADQYTKDTQDMSDAMQIVYDNFPSYLQIENGIMDAVAIEKSTNTTITELTVADPVAIDVTAAQSDSTDGSSDSSSDSSDSTSTTDSSSSDSSTTDGSNGTADTESGTDNGSSGSNANMRSSVSGYQLYDVNSVMAFTTEYHGLKAMLQQVIGSTDKKTISSLSVNFDDSTGELTGELNVDSYFLYGLDKPYEAPVIPSVPHGTDNLFGTLN
ncbi:type II secretion system protein GspM [Agathobacter sp.]